MASDLTGGRRVCRASKSRATPETLASLRRESAPRGTRTQTTTRPQLPLRQRRS